MFDLLIKGGLLVDPKQNRFGEFDIGINNGVISEVSSSLDPSNSKRLLNAKNKVVIPGIIDMHVHTGFVCNSDNAMGMMVKQGTVTALDCGGPMNDLYKQAINNGVGMNMIGLQMVKPYWNISNETPSNEEIDELIDRSLEEGAIGLKLLGGHYPLTPNATRNVIQASNKKGAYIAFHVGTTKSGAGNLNSFKEAVMLSKDYSVHLAHVNSYCRGQILDSPIQETLEVLTSLEENPNLFSESYLSIFSGAPGKCIDGKIESIGTANSLGMGGYEKNEKGLRQAILNGFASVVKDMGEENIRISGPEAINYWEKLNGDVTVTFPVTPQSTRFLLATEKTKEGRFIVDAISTDGGCIPRNFIVDKGTALVQMDALTWNEYVLKTSYNPARILGLKNKGHLGIGADADISILEGTTGRAYAAINRGNIIMIDGVITGEGTTIITTKKGEKSVIAKGLKADILDLKEGWFFQGRPKGGKIDG